MGGDTKGGRLSQSTTERSLAVGLGSPSAAAKTPLGNASQPREAWDEHCGLTVRGVSAGSRWPRLDDRCPCWSRWPRAGPLPKGSSDPSAELVWKKNLDTLRGRQHSGLLTRTSECFPEAVSRPAVARSLCLLDKARQEQSRNRGRCWPLCLCLSRLPSHQVPRSFLFLQVAQPQPPCVQGLPPEQELQGNPRRQPGLRGRQGPGLLLHSHRWVGDSRRKPPSVCGLHPVPPLPSGGGSRDYFWPFYLASSWCGWENRRQTRLNKNSSIYL